MARSRWRDELGKTRNYVRVKVAEAADGWSVEQARAARRPRK